MSQNIYDDETFFNNYAKLPRSMNGLSSAPEYPYLKNLLPSSIKDGKVLDLGCGYGWFCRDAIKLGAKSVLGLDLSEKMINRAKIMDTEFDLENTNGKKDYPLFGKTITYEIQDLEKFKPTSQQKESFDIAYSVFVFHYLLDFDSFIQNVYQSLKKGGTLLFTVEHPIYTSSKHNNWWIDYDNDSNKKIWPVSHYSYEGERVSNWMAEGVKKQHRTIGTYVNSLINAGFTIAHLNEWSPTDSQIKENPDLLIEKERPMILIIKAIKN